MCDKIPTYTEQYRRASKIFILPQNNLFLRGFGSCASVSVLKRKTSITIDEKLLAVLKREAKRQDRSVSYILEKFIESKVASIAEESGQYGNKPRQRDGSATR